tara:strand:- start:5820 stop:8417 length:2598 start_codon:yes stop_codon:yes gene_type:complete
MGDEITQADITKLVNALNELVGKQQDLIEGMKDSTKSEAASTSRDRGDSSSLSSRSTDKGYEETVTRENKALARQLELLESERTYRGELSEQKKLEEQQLQERLNLLARLEYEQDPAKRAKMLKDYDKLTKGQKKMNKELERGAGKFELLSNKMLKVDGAAAALQEHIPMSVAEIKAFGKSLIDSVKSGEIFIAITKKIAAATLNLSVALEKTNAALSRQHGIAQDGYGTMSKQAQVSRSVERELALVGVTSQEAAAAQGALISKMSSFTQLSEKQKGSLTKQAALMQELGVQSSTTAEIFDKATKSLGMGADQMEGLTRRLKDTADSLGLPLSRVAQDFNLVATELAFYGDDIEKVFEGLEKQAKATGLSMQQLLKIGGAAFDTFDGAAQKVGRLNAILGGPYLNSIDMLNASEEERLELLTASMDASGKMYGDLGKYEQKAIADALGVSTEEANRLFGNLSAAEELEIKHKEEMAETARKAQASMDKLANAFNHLLITMDPLFAAFEWFAEKVSWLAGTGGGKLVMRIGLYTAGFLGLVAAAAKGAKVFARFGKVMRVVGLKLRFKPLVQAGIRISRFFGKVPGFGQIMLNFGKLVMKPFQLLAKGARSLGGIGTRLGGIGTRLGELVTRFRAAPEAITKMAKSFRGLRVIRGIMTGARVGIGLVTKGLGLLVRGATSTASIIVGAFTTVYGAVKGVIDVAKAGGGIFDKFTGALLGAASAMGELLDWASFGVFDKIMKFTTGGSSFRDLLGNVDMGDAGHQVFGVGDAIITNDGKIIEPSPQDTIIAAKPQGPIASMLGFGHPAGTETTPPGAEATRAAPAAQGGTAATNQTINVNVRIGERELKDIIKEVIPETITSFANP